MEFISPMPFQEAIDKLGEQSVVGSTFTSSEWADVPLELRDNAFFSSRVESAQFLQRAQNSLGDFLAGNRETLPDGQTVLATGSRAAFVSQMQDFLAGEGVVRSTGGLTDIASERRLGLIFSIKTKQAQDFGYWKQGMDPAVLNEFPAQRFIRVREVKTERVGHIPYEDQVFLKTDPIWELQINKDFGVPWGPWGWGCGHDVEDVDRDESDKLGLTRPGQVLTPHPRSLNKNLQASIKNLDPDLVAKLEKEFGSAVRIDHDAGTMQWVAERQQSAAPLPAPPQVSLRSSPVSAALELKVGGEIKAQMRAAIAAIDQVHGDGVLPTIPVNSSQRSAYGYLDFYAADGTPVKIGIRPTSPWPALTMVHETGHFLDLSAIGSKGSFATLTDPDMKAVIAAAMQTSKVKMLQAKLAATSSSQMVRMYQYLLKPEEIWARAYAQFIATRSTSNLLKGQLEKSLIEEPDKQWSSEDFAPIGAAIEKLFTTLGWL